MTDTHSMVFTVVFSGVRVPITYMDTHEDIQHRLIAMIQQGEFNTVDVVAEEQNAH